MAATNFKTENNTYRKLVGNGLTYRIPRFQRDYSWTEEEWEDLWLDLLGTREPDGESAHYMGYLVLQSSDDKAFEVIDGQQRLTTISLLVLAVLKHLLKLVDTGQNPDANRQRMEQIRQTYVGYLDPVTLVARPKLVLNRNNNSYYQDYLVALGHLPQRGFRASEHLLRKAFEFFERKVAEELKKGPADPGRSLAQLVEDMSDRFFFTVITVTDELNAYKVFETLNARGVRLSATDLLKNYFFSVLDRKPGNEHELQSLESRWEAMIGRLGAESFPDFLRIHWNSRRNFARQAELFKTIRGQVRSREDVFRILREMDEDLDTFLALSSPEASDWSPDNKQHASTLKTFSVRQPYPLLLAARRSLGQSEFDGLLRACVTLSLRYNIICGYSTGEQETVYNRVAKSITLGELDKLSLILGAMSAIYPKDPAFRTAFAEKIIRTTQTRNNRIVRYILSSLEKHLSGRDYSSTSDSYSVEHILPQNPEGGWEAFSNEEAAALVYRLGNMTLLKTGSNRDLGGQTYAAKRVVYEQSEFDITRKVATDHAEWTPERIAAHQGWMANQATSIWRIAQLS
jgi:hypothetical protein